MNFHQRKKARTMHYMLFVYKWKLRKCFACNGSGVYDVDGSPRCSSCEGSGKERYKVKQD